MRGRPVNPVELAEAAEALRNGQAVIVPTDTVYGLAALPTVVGATDRLFALKGRDTGQPMAVLVADALQGLALMDLPDDLIELVEVWVRRFWPGALTIVGPRSEVSAAFSLGGGSEHRETIGVRCPANALVRALASDVGPLATTSANRSGEPTPISTLR